MEKEFVVKDNKGAVLVIRCVGIVIVMQCIGRRKKELSKKCLLLCRKDVIEDGFSKYFNTLFNKRK